MMLSAWATRWGVPRAALEELLLITGAYDLERELVAGASESAVQSRVRLEAAQKGVVLWRNNVGAGELKDGTFLRWGLANDTKQLNERFKSSDLVGLRSFIIEPAHVGMRIAQFTARECKPQGWRFSNSPREIAQQRYIDFVNARGGDARFATGEGTL